MGKRVRCEFRDRWEKWGGNGVKNLTELSNPSLSSQLCLSRYSFLRRAPLLPNKQTCLDHQQTEVSSNTRCPE